MRIVERRVAVTPAHRESVERALREHYYTGWRAEDSYSHEGFRLDLDAHVTGRLEADRRRVIPWLDRSGTLDGCEVIEIGCGTGASSVALAEQGAILKCVDIDEGALRVAEHRLEVMGLNAAVHKLNATSLVDRFGVEAFDMAIFFACLEHMTISERIHSLREAWTSLRSGGRLVVVDTPNRLWHFDLHTAMLPFYQWLPNELAFRYARFSPRENFNDLYHEYDEATKEHFLRRGRGVSFHELELGIDRVAQLDIVSSISTYEGPGFELRLTANDRRFKSVLRRMHPDLHAGFFDPVLEVIIRKP